LWAEDGRDEQRRNEAQNRYSQNFEFQHFQNRKLEECRSTRIGSICFNQPSRSCSRLAANFCFSLPLIAVILDKNLTHARSAPNEATTSIWLKAVMVRSDLRGNTEVGK
jgi:hypothetical protein